MSNILEHNRNIFDIVLDKENYWDFHLSTDYNSSVNTDNNRLTTHCLSSYIDFNNPKCVWMDRVFSLPDYKWENAINKGVILNSIGYTGVDNGFITFEKDSISNKKFLELFTKSKLRLDENDIRFVLNKINGNNQLYYYGNNIVVEDGIGVARLRGGFYQGFFKTKCNEYQVLPSKIDDGITIEITLKKSNDVVNDKRTLNSVHPDNEGIFFFIGTRAENKWIKNYITEYSNADDNSNYVKDDYMKDNVFKKEATNEPYTSETDTSIDSEYLKPSEECKIGKYTSNGYSDKDYLNENDTCDIYNNYFIKGGYLADDEIINDDDFTTEEGYNIYQPNIEEIKTDNKFITYNRTKNGLDIDSDDGNTETILYNIKCPELENYFTLFNRTDNGYTIENIDSLLKVESKKYSVNKDIINNALCFRITSDGRLGYRYLTKDCDSEDGIGIIEEYTEQPLINNNVWYCISTKIQKCSNDKMKLSFYVNGKLKMITKEIPILELRELNDLYSKQEGVPYNMSVGGGTQGLCDVIYPLYRDNPSIIYPLEKYFAGSFIGDIRSFRFYSCLLNGNEIENNYKNDII